ncbi:MAG: hypothetical protein A2W01_03570 [Candidatus Solincola sediminis]|uniref:Putative zinc-ribbon domain-containing protein n=1 Tax=Candidatus Solincola sediminis TaxID=1797199 RepID=A0A1F2WQR5_9ACTN|nr:MAG: hypothetical protein A2W01_03570 [Candidatus Solincola sediminis]OFW59232.1 MAG: hypothetical protein A2Y75_01785 [Candidatus Solincola sediminis]
MDEQADKKQTICKCPYCEGEIKITSESEVICQPCMVNIVSCPKCGKPMREGQECCPDCGSD